MNIALKTFSPNTLGIFACIFWALSPTLVCSLRSIPPFEVLLFMYSISFSLILHQTYQTHSWSSITTLPKLLSLISVMGICGNDIFYILSLRLIAPEHAELIAYLWPIFSLTGMSFFGKINLNKYHFIGIFCAFFGVAILLVQNTGLQDFNISNLGYLIAISGALIWSVYNILAGIYKNTSEVLFIPVFGVGLLMSLCLHLHYESFIIPNVQQMASIAFMGITTHYLAYTFWDYGIKKGNFILLNSLCYCNPIASIFVLIIFGHTQSNALLWVAAILICTGCLISNTNPKTFKNLFQQTHIFNPIKS